ncbi:MAG: LptF/LptG family permease, partial [Planctomycetota bacterium]
ANRIFAPAAEDVDQAKAVIAAFADPANAGKGVLKVNGRVRQGCHRGLRGAFTSMEELTRLAETDGGMPLVLMKTYGPLLLLLFDWTGAIMVLMSFLFTVGWLRRTGELTATLSAGVSHGRIFRPILIASFAIILVQLASRETLLPRMRDRLTMKAKDIDADAEQAIHSRYDKANGILVDGRSLVARKQTILDPSFLLYGDFPGFGELLKGKQAVWLDENADHPSGFLVQGVTKPENVSNLPSFKHDNRAVLLTASDQPWLGPTECFVATMVQIDLLQTNATATRQASVLELIRLVCNPAVHSPESLRVYLHERIVRVPLDTALVMLILPLVVNRRQKNLFVSIGTAIGIILFFFGLKTVAGGVASSGYLLSPVMAAWTPLLVIGPVAYVRYRAVQLV